MGRRNHAAHNRALTYRGRGDSGTPHCRRDGEQRDAGEWLQVILRRPGGVGGSVGADLEEKMGAGTCLGKGGRVAA